MNPATIANRNRRAWKVIGLTIATLLILGLLPLFPKYLFGPGLIGPSQAFAQIADPYSYCHEIGGGELTMLNDCFSRTARTGWLINIARMLTQQ
jgi:hypothetical protein